MSIFDKKAPLKDRIPILNKPPANPPPSAAQPPSFCNDNPDFKHYGQFQHAKPKVPRRFEPPAEYPEYVDFGIYEHFIHSVQTIRQLCGSGDNCDLHIVFKEPRQSLPQIGVSPLTYQDLCNDEAKLQGKGTTPAELGFIKMIPYSPTTVPNLPPAQLSLVKPKANQTLTVTVDISDETGLQIRFTFMDEPSSNWFYIKYPPFIDDFSLVIAIHRNDLLRKNEQNIYDGSLEVYTTFGWLQWRKQQLQQQAEAESVDAPTTSNNAEQQPRQQFAEECIVCLNNTAELLFYPCNHLIVCLKCSERDWHKLEAGEKGCYKCNEPCQKIIPLKFRGPNCLFCDPGANCQQFDSYCFPCGCSLGCFEGFQQNPQQLVMLQCLNCGKSIENIENFFH